MANMLDVTDMGVPKKLVASYCCWSTVLFSRNTKCCASSMFFGEILIPHACIDDFW